MHERSSGTDDSATCAADSAVPVDVELFLSTRITPGGRVARGGVVTPEK